MKVSESLGSSVISEKWRINPNVDTVFSFAVLLSVRGYYCWSAFLWFLSVLLSLIYSESTRFWYTYRIIFYRHQNVNLWCKCAYEIALIFLTFPDLLGDLGNKTEKIEIEMKEVKETISSLTLTMEKSTDEGWLPKRATHR